MIRLFALITILLLAGCQSNSGSDGTAASPAAAAATNTEPVPVLREMQGEDASLTAPGAALINDAKQTKVNLAPLEVDFERESVVIVSLGRQPTGNYGVKINSAQRKGAKLFVQGIAMQPKNLAIAPKTPTHPYAAVVIPKFNGTVHPEIVDAP